MHKITLLQTTKSQRFQLHKPEFLPAKVGGYKEKNRHPTMMHTDPRFKATRIQSSETFWQ